MTTKFIYNGIIFVPRSNVSAARQWLADNNPDPLASPDKALLVKLSPIGADPATHYGAYGGLTADFIQALGGARDGGLLSWSYRAYALADQAHPGYPANTLLSVADSTLGVTLGLSTSTAQVGSIFSWSAALADSGLQRIEDENLT